MGQYQERRWAARRSVLADPKLSGNARALYMAVDDMAGNYAIAWGRTQTFASRLSLSVSQVRRLFKELEGRYLTSRRQKNKATTRTLLWNLEGAYMRVLENENAHKRAPERAKMRVDLLISEPVLFNQSGPMTCEKCKDQGQIQFQGQFLFCDCSLGLAILDASVVPTPAKPCDCEGTGYYPVGSGIPCRSCDLGWSLAKSQERRRA